MHLRAPSVAPGVSAFLWCLVFAFYVWLFAVAVGVSEPVAALLGALVGGAVFLLVRLYGEDLTRRGRARS
jgi:positive regulator of sigma E activity